MSEEKSFSSLNGYPVKDATARESIEQLKASTQRGINSLWDFIGNSTQTIMNNIYTRKGVEGRAIGEVVRVDDVSPNEHNVKVRVFNKNLIPYPFSNTTKTEYGITFTDNGDGTITVNGTAEKNSDFVLINTGKNFTIPKGEYFVSGSIENVELRVYANKGTTTNIVVSDSGDGALFDLTNVEYDYVCAYIRVLAGATLNNVVLKPQLEIGTETKGYVPYVNLVDLTVKRYGVDEKDNLQTYKTDSNGYCSIISLSPTMTVKAEGVMVEVEYNKDINVVLGDIDTALDSIISIQNSLTGGEA